jgi:hypothetical protein
VAIENLTQDLLRIEALAAYEGAVRGMSPKSREALERALNTRPLDDVLQEASHLANGDQQVEKYMAAVIRGVAHARIERDLHLLPLKDAQSVLQRFAVSGARGAE